MRSLYALVLVLVARGALADVTVYRSVDPDGTVRFSDRPPENEQSLPIRIEADAPPPSPEVAERREQMRQVTDQLQADRIERERIRAEAAAMVAAQQAPLEPGNYDDPDYLPIYYPYHPRPPRWEAQPPHRPPIPRPNPRSASPRGQLERLRQQY